MIFQQLKLQNFGQFKGTHSISLTTSTTRPILLIGGHNGGGKTTILDAMQLCLYGKRSHGYRRVDQRWNEYLHAWINRDSELNAGTRIELSLQHPYKGKDSIFRIVFSWNTNGNSIIEQKEIFIDNILDQSITASWDQFIDSILPARLSTLFFFDGEQIENLVRQETAQQFLESAISELLGIGTIEQLQRDLSVLNRNKSLQNNPKEESQKLEEAENEYSTIQTEVCNIEELLIKLKKQRKNELKQLEIFDSEYESKGGKLLDQQAVNENLKKELEQQLDDLNKKIIKEQSGILPLYLVKKQLQKINSQIQKEIEAENCINQQKELNRLHKKYIAAAQQHGASDKIIEALYQLEANEIERIESRLKDTEIYLNLSPNTKPILEMTLKELPGIETLYRQLHVERSHLEKKLETLNAQLDATPEKGALKELFSKRVESSKKLSEIEFDLHIKKILLEKFRMKSKEIKERVIRLLEESAQETAQIEDNKRTMLYSIRAQKYLKEFRNQLLSKHLGKLEAYIFESFQQLIRKQSLVHNLTINEESFAITLTNNEGKAIPAEKLSAGERQLLAIAIFWGLQKATNRSIPVMIDTPLGRLDSNHRDHLIRHYFPFAAHQLILLSTDEEIVGDYYTQISKYTYKELTVEYDEKNLSTQIKKGYFR